MFRQSLIVSLLLVCSGAAAAGERYLINFELSQGESRIDLGKAFVSGKKHTWSKGLQRSYLQLRCQTQEKGRVQKLYSTVDHFAGLRVTHQLVDDRIELTVIRDVVQPRLQEIRALGKTECTPLSPIVTQTTQSYTFTARDGSVESRPFGENMTFHATLQAFGGTR